MGFCTKSKHGMTSEGRVRGAELASFLADLYPFVEKPKLHMVLTADWDQPLPHEDWHGLDRQSEDVAETEKD